jgi:6-phosphogluconolactonase
MTEPAFHVLDDPGGEVAALLAAQATAGGSIVLTGGSSVGEVYERAAILEPDWHRATVWWGDERCVTPGDGRSNYGLARRTLLDRLSGPPEVHRMRGEAPPAEAADEYAAELSGVDLDLMLLGIGTDGHIASLFADSPQLAERNRLVTHGPARLTPFVERITMTLPTVLSSKRIVVFATGFDKARAVARAFLEEIDESVPGSLLRRAECPLDVYLDRMAASDVPA